LWVVLTEPDAQDAVLCVCFVTHRSYTDATTTCEPGEHPFFEHLTAVAYNYAEFLKVRRIENNLDGGAYQRRQRCSDKLLKKVQDGIRASDFTPKRILKRLG
jgi:hypothetical protein